MGDDEPIGPGPEIDPGESEPPPDEGDVPEPPDPPDQDGLIA
jgi:hypothetical protein